MDELLSTKQLGWVLGRSAGTVRDMIRDGEIEAVRIPSGFRIPRAEVLRLARDRIEAEAGRNLPDRKLEELIDEVIATNEPRG
jgi:excisionase family DNA binding protein